MYCHECGTGNTVDSKYCKECGTRINDGYRAMMQSVQPVSREPGEETRNQLTRLLDMAFWHNEAGNREAAITAAEAALALHPDSTTAHSLLGTLYEKSGDDSRAISHFEAVLDLNPDSPADAAKLDQLRRGVHVKAVAPPAAHLWLPPGLLRLAPQLRQRWTALAPEAKPFRLPGRLAFAPRPVYAAGAAALLVLVSGLLLLRPWAKADAVTLASAPASAPAASAADRSAFAAPASPDTSSPAPEALTPMVLTAAPSTTMSYASAYPAPALTTHDPFAAGRTAAPSLSPVWSLPPVPHETAAARRRRLAQRDLPVLPLRLTALPAVGSGELAPAPVSVPDGAAPLATVASIPQHTVVVTSLGQTSAANPPPTSEPEAHIHITVQQSRSADTPPPSDNDAGAGQGADSYQQRALALQQGGEYGQARAVYQRAIHAYQAQIASGRDIDTAQRGLAACQTGLQICQQSQ